MNHTSALAQDDAMMSPPRMVVEPSRLINRIPVQSRQRTRSFPFGRARALAGPNAVRPLRFAPAHNTEKAGRVLTPPAWNSLPFGPGLGWNFFLNLLGGITNLD